MKEEKREPISLFDSRVFDLISRFPTLAAFCDKDRVQRPFSIEELKAFETTEPAAIYARCFVCDLVEDGNTFNVVAALNHWDSAHKSAFFRYAHNPFSHEV